MQMRRPARPVLGSERQAIGFVSRLGLSLEPGMGLSLRAASLAKLMVYSMAVDGPVRSEAPPSRSETKFPSRQVGHLAGSKAMESLDRFITSTESFFHPSNSGLWSLSVRKNVVFFSLC